MIELDEELLQELLMIEKRSATLRRQLSGLVAKIEAEEMDRLGLNKSDHGKIECPYCQSKYRGLDNIRRHIREKH